ncbi:MAG: SBBP repeat-containing protein [Dehalococcoidia bacterium]
MGPEGLISPPGSRWTGRAESTWPTVSTTGCRCLHPKGRFWGCSAAKASLAVSSGSPVGIATDPSGNIYVTDGLNHRIQVFGPVRAP